VRTLRYVDAANVWLLGYDLGAIVALHAAALDERVGGVALAGLSPSLRGGLVPPAGVPPHLSCDYALLPPSRAREVAGEADLPYDVPHLLASLAPRPALVISPQLDWAAPVVRATAAVAGARPVYALHGAPHLLTHLTPEAFGHFGPEHQALAVEWLRSHTGAGAPAGVRLRTRGDSGPA
jgi:hypothetical protein